MAVPSVNVYAADGRLVTVPLTQLPSRGPWVEVTPVEGGDDVVGGLRRALARSTELSGTPAPPRWDGGDVRDGGRLVARVDADIDADAYVYVAQERLEDEYGTSWVAGPSDVLPDIEAVTARLMADVASAD